MTIEYVVIIKRKMSFCREWSSSIYTVLDEKVCENFYYQDQHLSGQFLPLPCIKILHLLLLHTEKEVLTTPNALRLINYARYLTKYCMHFVDNHTYSAKFDYGERAFTVFLDKLKLYFCWLIFYKLFIEKF